jgi:two-component system, NarL family, response regulator NreC
LSKKIQVLLADDHTILRRGVKMLIASQKDMEVVGEANTGRAAIEEAERLRPDVIVMDVSMPELNGIEATRQICTKMPKAKIVALSMHRDSVYVREILRAGARGYLLKESEDEELLKAIRFVHQGRAYLSPDISDTILGDYGKQANNPVDLLTAREREVLQMIAEGKTNKEVAGALGLSVYTIESHRGSVMEKLNLHSTGDIIRFAVRNGLIS